MIARLRRWRRPASAVLAVMAIALVAAACGGGDDGGGGGGATATATGTTGEDAGVITSSTGAECSARTPDPPADPTTYSAAPPLTIDTVARPTGPRCPPRAATS